MAAFLTIATYLAIALLAAVIAAAVLEAIGPNRLARWLGLPKGDYS